MSASPNPTRAVPKLSFVAAKSAVHVLIVSSIILPHSITGRVFPDLTNIEEVVIQMALSAGLIFILLAIMSLATNKKPVIVAKNNTDRSKPSSRLLTNIIPLLIGCGLIYISRLFFMVDPLLPFIFYVLITSICEDLIDRFLIGRKFFCDPRPNAG